MSGEVTGSDEPGRRVADLADDIERYHRRYESARDSRAVFAYAYLELTRDLADRLADASPGFDDPGWVADLAAAFGTRYVAAMDAIDDWEQASDSGTTDVASLERTVPQPWADVYRAICRERSTVLEDLAFGMGAHITYDLPHALLDVGTETSHLADYHRMNDVLASRIDVIQDAVTDRYNRTLSRLDRVAAGADEVVTDYWIRIGRSMAWYNAMRLQSPHSRAAAEGSIDRATFHLVRSVRSTGPWPLRAAVGAYRRLLPLTRRWPRSPPDRADRTGTESRR